MRTSISYVRLKIKLFGALGALGVLGALGALGTLGALGAVTCATGLHGRMTALFFLSGFRVCQRFLEGHVLSPLPNKRARPLNHAQKKKTRHTRHP